MHSVVQGFQNSQLMQTPIPFTCTLFVSFSSFTHLIHSVHVSALQGFEDSQLMRVKRMENVTVDRQKEVEEVRGARRCETVQDRDVFYK